MAYTVEQLIAAYTAATNGIAPSNATIGLLAGYAAQTAAGLMPDSTALSFVVNAADNTTAVAAQAYQFFTGKTPTKAGLDFLVNSPTNTNDLNDAYYAQFNIENRYINFAANLGLLGEGASAFASTYGSMSYAAFVAAAYETIIGTSYAVAAGINVPAALADINGRQQNFINIALERGLITASSTAAQVDIATKAALVGYLLVEGVKADVGIYAAGSNNFIQALIAGTPQYNVNLLTTYSILGGGVGQAVPGAGASSSLTVSPDTILGSGANDTYTGLVFSDSAATSTFNVADTLNAVGGADVLNLTVSKSGGGATGAVALPAALVSNVETINVRSLSTNASDVTSVTAANFTGATAINSDRSTNAMAITGLAVGAAAGMIGDNATATGDVSFGYATGGTAAIFNVSGGTKGGLVSVNSSTAAVTLNSTASAYNLLGGLNVGGASALTINAAAGLTTGSVSGFSGTTATITVGGAVASVASTTGAAGTTGVNLGMLSSAVATLNASGLTTGGVTVNIGANAGLNFTGGAGNDLVLITPGTAAALTGVINGGGGTGDMVVFSTDVDLSAPIGAKFTNFEIGAFASTGGGGVYTPTQIAGLTTILALISATPLTLRGFAAAPTVVVSGNQGGLTVQLADASGADSATVTLNNSANPAILGALSTTGVTISSLTLGGNGVAGQVETLNLVSSGAINSVGAYNSVTLANSGGAPFADPNTIVVTGTVGLTLNSGLLAHNLSVSAAALTGGGLNFSSAAGGAFQVDVTGSAANDSITVGTGQTGTITGGAGGDLIALNAGFQTVAYAVAAHSTLDLSGTAGASGTGTAFTGTMDKVVGFATGIDQISLAGISGAFAGQAITDRGAAATASDITTLLATAAFFSGNKMAQFDITILGGGTLFIADIDGSNTYNTGDLVVFLAGVSNIVAGDIA